MGDSVRTPAAEQDVLIAIGCQGQCHVLYLPNNHDFKIYVFNRISNV